MKYMNIFFEKHFCSLKKVLGFVPVLLLVFMLVSCSFGHISKSSNEQIEQDSKASETGLNETDLIEEKHFYKISGKADIQGTVPISFLETNSSSENKNVRSAIPSFSSSNVKYSVNATNSSGENVDSAEFDFGTDFSIELTNGTWELTAKAYYSSDSSKTTIMSGKKSVSVSNSAIPGILIDLEPNKTGTGKVSLNIGFDSATTQISQLRAQWTINRKSYSKVITDGTVASFDLIPEPASSDYYSEVPAGTHNVTFNFFDASFNMKYWFSQTINVFAGMTTDVWKKENSEYIDEGLNQVYVTAQMTNNFSAKSYFVSSSGNNTGGNGSYFSPFQTIQKAVDKIVAANETNQTDYTIYLLSSINGDDTNFTNNATIGNSLVSIAKGTNALSLTIEPLGTTSLDINAARTSSSSVKYRAIYANNVNLTLRNLNIYGGYVETQNGGGIFIDGGNATIEDCTIGKATSEQENLAEGTLNTTLIPTENSNSNYSGNYGGGIYANNANVSLKNSKVVNCFAKSRGGGIYANGMQVTSTPTEILTIDKDSVIYANNCADSNHSGISMTSMQLDLYGTLRHHNGTAIRTNMNVVLNVYSGSKIIDNYCDLASLVGVGVNLNSSADRFNMFGGTISHNIFNLSGTQIETDVKSYSGVAMNIQGDSYIGSVNSQNALIEIKGELTSLSQTRKTKIYTEITEGKTVLQSSDVDLQDCVDFFELYDYTKNSESTKFNLKVDSSVSPQVAKIASTRIETVYLDTTSGDDSNSGENYSLPVKTMQKASELLDSSSANPTIYVMNTINVDSDLSSDASWTFPLSGSSPKVTLKRYGGENGGSGLTGKLLNIASSGKLNASGIIFDGNKTAITATSVLIDVEANTDDASSETGGVLNLTNCIIQNNKNSNAGGGLNIASPKAAKYGTATLTNCSVINNEAKSGAGILVVGMLYMDGGEISGNVSTNDNGGGINCYASAEKLFMKNVSIKNNSASNGNGGGIALNGGNRIYLESCSVTGNSAPNGNGGGVYDSGHLVLFGTTNISDNSALSYGNDICWANLTTSASIKVGTTGTTEFTLGGKKVTPAQFNVSGGNKIKVVPASSENESSKKYPLGKNILSYAERSGSVSAFKDMFEIEDDDTTDSYTWFLDDNGNLQWTGASGGSGSIKVSLSDDIEAILSGTGSDISNVNLSTIGQTDYSIDVSDAEGNQVNLTSTNTTVALYNGGVLYADPSVTATVSAQNTISVSGGVAPGAYQLLVTFNYNGKTYQATFDLTAEDTD